MKRRTFLAGALASAASTRAIGTIVEQPIDVRRFAGLVTGKTDHPLDILFLGGRNFVGPPTISALRQRGHRVTMFNRGKTNPYLFHDIEWLHGDRHYDRGEGLSALEGDRKWDVVIDTWRDNPLVVRDSVQLLKNRVSKYLYVSSIAVYGNDNYRNLPEIFEDTPLPDADWPTTHNEDVSYRPAKILADQAVREVMGTRGLVARCHGIYGFFMHPETEGQTYWPERVMRGGDILAPSDGRDLIQYVDVLDLAQFLVSAAEGRQHGVYNLGRRITFRDYLTGLQALTQTHSNLHWVPREVLSAEELNPFSSLPLWVPRQIGPAFQNISDKRAVDAGLEYRDFAATFTDVIDGHRVRFGADFKFDESIMSPDREREVLHRHGYMT